MKAELEGEIRPVIRHRRGVLWCPFCDRSRQDEGMDMWCDGCHARYTDEVIQDSRRRSRRQPVAEADNEVL